MYILVTAGMGMIPVKSCHNICLCYTDGEDYKQATNAGAFVLCPLWA